MSRQIDLQSVLSDDELEYLESRGRDADLAVNAAFLINESDGDPETPSDADHDGEADNSEGDEDKTGDPPDPVAGDDQSQSETAKVEASTATRAPAKKS